MTFRACELACSGACEDEMKQVSTHLVQRSARDNAVVSLRPNVDAQLGSSLDLCVVQGEGARLPLGGIAYLEAW
ncbi:MAG: hypothetical protein QW057_10545 [Candidatus Bathyarchaeia archaeon]